MVQSCLYETVAPNSQLATLLKEGLCVFFFSFFISYFFFFILQTAYPSCDLMEEISHNPEAVSVKYLKSYLKEAAVCRYSSK